ncbi:MAG: hypothetical protein ACYDAZ_00620 [Thermoplasmataceae archaeon]
MNLHQAHNDRVIAQSDSRLDPPERDRLDITQSDVIIPEPVKIFCLNDHAISEEKCMVCENELAELIKDRVEVGCYQISHEVRTPASLPDQRLAGKYYEDTHYEFEVRGHVCMNCWEDLPEGGF